MKIWIAGLVLFVLGVGEYGFVEYVPLSPEARIHKLQKLPGIRSIVRAIDIRDLREAIEESDFGYVSTQRNGGLRKWNDANHLYADYESGDMDAYLVVDRIRNREAITELADQTRSRASSGDLYSMFRLYRMGQYRFSENDMKLAVELLEDDDSPTARFILDVNIYRSVPLFSRKGILLQAKSALQNYRRPGITEAEYRLMSDQNNAWLSSLRQAAADGDPDTAWVIAQLGDF